MCKPGSYFKLVLHFLWHLRLEVALPHKFLSKKSTTPIRVTYILGFCCRLGWNLKLERAMSFSFVVCSHLKKPKIWEKSWCHNGPNCASQSVARVNTEWMEKLKNKQYFLFLFYFSLQGVSHISCMPGPVRRWNYPPPLCIGNNLSSFIHLFLF